MDDIEGVVKEYMKPEPTQIVASDFRQFIKKRIIEILGLALIGLACALATSLITYEPSDPSYNSTASTIPFNKLGIIGSYSADILIQWLGVAAYLLVPTFLIWGIHMLTSHRLKFYKLRLLSLLLGGAFVAAGVANSALSFKNILHPEGAVGTVLDQNLMALVHTFHLPPVLVPLFTSLIGAALLLFAWGIPFQVWKVMGNAFKNTTLKTVRLLARLMRPRRPDHSLITPTHVVEEPETTPESFPAPEQTAMPFQKKAAAKKSQAKKIQQSDFGQKVGDYTFPSPRLLQEGTNLSNKSTIQSQTLKESGEMLKSTLDDFGVKGEITDIKPGPVVTLYEFKPAPGTKSSRVIGLADDIARSMSAISARISVIPGYNALGIELPNAKRQTVYMRGMLEDKTYTQTNCKLPIALGRDIGGEPVIADITKMPHLLVAGTTGSGKSVSVNTMILSLIYHLTPDQCKFIMIDPKMLELSVYDGIPHLLTPVVTDPHKAVMALKWAVREMESRYQSMSKVGVRNIDGYNKKITEAINKGEKITRNVQTGFDPETGHPTFEDQEIPLEHMPYIVVIVDEMADLMLVAGKDIEAAVQRLAQMARAAGIHLIMATQRPSVDVITGTIKANFPTRISFSVTSKIDSRTILGEQGAEQLLGQGDMLYMAAGGRVTRVHGPFVADDEVERLVHFLKSQGEPKYENSVVSDDNNEFGTLVGGDSGDSGDALYDQALALVIKDRKASTSYIQRCLQIGYNRAARIVDRMEKEGVVSPANHVGKREILIKGQE